MSEWDESSQPKRILQIYDADKQRQFEHFSTQNRLEWLAAINSLYWQARSNAPRKAF